MEQEQNKFAEIMTKAITLQQNGNLDEAELIYRDLLAKNPHQAEPLHFLGVLLHQRQPGEESIQLIIQSIQRQPQNVYWRNTLGNVLFSHSRFIEAAAEFQIAVDQQPDFESAWINLGATLQQLGHNDEAVNAYKAALALNPTSVNTLSILGNLLASMGHQKESSYYFSHAVIADPDPKKSKKVLGMAYSFLGEREQAAEAYRQWTLEEPENPIASHMYAACSGHAIPKQASPQFVTKLFDEFADTFDTRIVENLKYHGPQLITTALAKVAPPLTTVECLELGCGTGLCGPCIKPYTKKLVGIDLSTKMLAKAAERHVYDELVNGELVSYLRVNEKNYDLLVIADTLIYFGALEDVFSGANQVLRPQGIFIFTVEELFTDEKVNYILMPSGRYAHTRSYLKNLLATNRFSICDMVEVTIRVENLNPLPGLVITARLQ